MNMKIALAAAGAAALLTGAVAVAQTGQYGQTPSTTQSGQPAQTQQPGMTPSPATPRAPADQTMGTPATQEPGAAPRAATQDPYQTTQPSSRMMTDTTTADGTEMQRAGERG